MKKLQVILLIAATIIPFVTLKAQESSFRLSTGFAVPMGSTILHQEYNYPAASITTNGTTHYRALSRTYGTGLIVGASYVRMFSKHVGIEVYENYQSGSKQVYWMFPDVASGLEGAKGSPYYSEGSTSSNSRGFSFSPLLIFRPFAGKKVQPYVKAGVVMGTVNLAIHSTENNINQLSGNKSLTSISQNSSGSSFGYRGGMGVLFNPGRRITFFAEMLFTSTRYHSSKSGLSEYTVNGVSQIDNYSGKSKAALNAMVGKTSTDPTRTIESIGSSPLTSVMLNVGLVGSVEVFPTMSLSAALDLPE